MATYISFSIRVEGRLHGAPEENEVAVGMFKEIFANRAESAGGEGWPSGFLQDGFGIAHWMASESVAGVKGDETVLSFFALQSSVRPGKMADRANRVFLMNHLDRVLSYRKSFWYLDLRAQVEQLNSKIEANKKGALIERVWFREQRHVEEDGGDM